jgi:hypothetical protein
VSGRRCSRGVSGVDRCAAREFVAGVEVVIGNSDLFHLVENALLDALHVYVPSCVDAREPQHALRLP